MMKKKIVMLAAAMLVFPGLCVCAEKPAVAPSGEEIAAEIIEMRSALAKNFIKPGDAITEETFKNVCGAVAKRVKEISARDGVVIRHTAVKNRNPKNAPSPEELRMLGGFSEGKTAALNDTASVDGKTYSRFVRPIYVEDACLACHGQKDKRPAFIVEKYPDDKAFDFKAGDLRGAIIVLTPAKQ